MTKTDLIIIGSGPGGYRAAKYATQNGLKVTIIEKAYAGGTCLNCGCIPTKTFCHDAEVIEEMRHANKLGVSQTTNDIDINKLQERKQQVVEQLRNGVETLMTSPGINFVHGKAHFVGSKTIAVDREEFTADNIIIATGSHAKIPLMEGINLPGVITSTELLDINHIPKSLCIIGAGVIGMEFASSFCSFGSKVTVIEFQKECLPTMDSDIAKRLRKTLEHREIEFNLQSGVKRIEKTDNGLTVTFEKKGKESTIEADIVLVSTGRSANTNDLSLEEAGITNDRNGITVDENMQTNVNGIYAIGDVNGRQMLAHAATFQGFRAINNILGKTDNIRFDIMPAAIFTNPEAASVGLSEDQCIQMGIDFNCHKGYYRANGKALAINATEGLVKLIIDSNEKIIGCHIYGAHASDMVQEITALMNHNATLSDLHNTIHIHPTLCEILQDI